MFPYSHYSIPLDHHSHQCRIVESSSRVRQFAIGKAFVANGTRLVEVRREARLEEASHTF
jgi:hypothetical protein